MAAVQAGKNQVIIVVDADVGVHVGTVKNAYLYLSRGTGRRFFSPWRARSSERRRS